MKLQVIAGQRLSTKLSGRRFMVNLGPARLSIKLPSVRPGHRGGRKLPVPRDL